MKEGAIIKALTLGGISIVLEHAVVWLELLIGLLSGHFEDDDHESSHQECSIDHPITWTPRTAVVEYPVLRVVLVSEESCQLSGVSVHHGKVQGSEILVEWEIGQIIVNIEEEGVLKILWRLCI